MDLGATLRRARQANRLTLEQLSRTTKISVANLRALEENDFDRLPANIYTRGFLRTFAREVGLDPEETVEQYLQQVEEETAQQLEVERREAEAVAATRHQQLHHEPSPTREHDEQRYPRSLVPAPLRIQVDLKSLPAPAAVTAGVVMLGVVIALVVWRGGRESIDEATAAAAAEPPAAQTEPVQPAADDVVRATNVGDGPLQIELKTTGPCWVSASADRAHVFARLMQAGDSQTSEAKDEFVMRVGDPSTLTVTVNGAALRSLGRPGVPVTVAMTRENLRELLAS
jgi:cytoskeleton protein RodZ